ncbi:MAG: hypothetical protein JXN10_07345 [Clostridia bacterium]|nr:hypothetical protein [Clostridia bacterium]MBN2883327.1 hypothetical protein [Clostridia bacterium]
MKDKDLLILTLIVNLLISLVTCFLAAPVYPETFMFGFPFAYLTVYNFSSFLFDSLAFLLSFFLTFFALKAIIRASIKIKIKSQSN